MDAAEALSLVQLKMGNQPDYQYYMKVKARDIAQMKVGNQLDYRYSNMMFTDPEALSGMQQLYSLRQYAHLPAWWFYNQWVLQESGEISLVEDMLAKIKAGNEEAFEFVLRLFFNYHILPERVKERILREKFSSELDEALQAGIAEGKEKYCVYHYPPEAEACESVVDGYEFRLLRNSDEYLEHYGIKGMRWGVRKAIERGGTGLGNRRLARQYRKAQKKLAKLEKQAGKSKKYARRAALMGAGAAAAVEPQ